MLFRSFFLSCFFILSFAQQSQAQFDNNISFLPVEQAYQLHSYFNQQGELELSWTISPGYYLYKHSYRFTLSKLTDNSDVTITPIIEPGLQKTDEYFGDVEVYYHNSLVTLKNMPKAGQFRLDITSQGCADAGLCYPPRKQSFELTADTQTLLDITASNAALQTNNNFAADNQAANISPPATPTSFWYAIALALLGGLILNLMPCVFPVLSLKALSFSQDNNHNHHIQGISYSLGVIISFVLVAALLISLQAAGKAVGWGFQLQSPWFVAALAYLFFVMGLSLSGIVSFGSSWMNLGSSLANRQGYSGSFFTGVLATVVASPCTAPFMGTALGYAITQDAFAALSIFAALGLGMAIPMLALGYSPALLNKIPKPGPWMEKLKQFLAFPLYATTLWLCWVIGKQTGTNGMLAALTGCLLLALAFWLWSNSAISKTLSLASAGLALWLIFSSALTPVSKTSSNNEWQAYTPERLTSLRQQGELIFINLTADWCITCLANERITLDTEAVKQAFKRHNVRYLKGDWTNFDPAIGNLLKEHGRTGIPLYLIYPPQANSQAIILPQILSKSLLLEQIQQFSR